MPAGLPKILIVEDDPQIAALLRVTLTRSGYVVVDVRDGRAALAARAIDRPDLVLLDLGLPDCDGLDLIAPLRGEPATRLIVVSARDATEQKVAALDLGADDYVTKPFDREELLARIRASLRAKLAAEAARQVVKAGDFTIDLLERRVTRGGVEVHLTPKEFAVLAELAKWPGRVLTHRHLLRVAWGPAHEDRTEYLRVTMRALRQKLEAAPAEPALLFNEPGVGYRLMASKDQPE